MKSKFKVTFVQTIIENFYDVIEADNITEALDLVRKQINQINSLHNYNYYVSKIELLKENDNV